MKMNKKVIFSLLIITLFVIAGCNQGDKGGTVSTPFLGGSTGVFIEFIKGNPPEQVYDGGSFDFDVLASLRNDGEYDISKGDIKISLYGIRPEDFGSILQDLTDLNPPENLIGKSRDSEGSVIEGIPVYVKFPPNDGDHLNYAGKLVGDRKDFTIRANVCYRYQTKAMAQYCVLKNLIDDAREDSICVPRQSKTIYSSGAPVQVGNFLQSVAGQDSIRIRFDVLHSGNGNVFEYGDSDSPAATCPRDPSSRRSNENRVFVTVDPGLGSVTCSGLQGNSGFVRLANGKRTVICTITLSPDRTDFEKELKITLDYNYEDDKDTRFLVLS